MIEIGCIDFDQEVEHLFYGRLTYTRLTCDIEHCTSSAMSTRGEDYEKFMRRAKAQGWLERAVTTRLFLCPQHSGKRAA